MWPGVNWAGPTGGRASGGRGLQGPGVDGRGLLGAWPLGGVASRGRGLRRAGPGERREAAGKGRAQLEPHRGQVSVPRGRAGRAWPHCSPCVPDPSRVGVGEPEAAPALRLGFQLLKASVSPAGQWADGLHVLPRNEPGGLQPPLRAPLTPGVLTRCRRCSLGRTLASPFGTPSNID